MQDILDTPRAADRWMRNITGGIAVVAIAGILLGAGVVVADVLGKWLFGHSVFALNEVMSLVFAVAVAATFPAGAANRVNLKIDLLAPLTGARMTAWLSVVGSLVLLAFFVMLALSIWGLGLRYHTQARATALLEVPLAPAYFVISLSMWASSAVQLLHVVNDTRAAVATPKDAGSSGIVVVLAALWNSCRLTGRRIGDLSVVIAGMGAAGVAVGRILLGAGVGSIVGVDRSGAVYSGRDNLNSAKAWFAEHTNPERKMGTLAEVLVGTDVFIGLSGPGLIDAANLRTMNPEPFVFAMANPEPEIRPEEADGLAAVMATGRSDYPNQINNVLAFPGIFRGALDVGAMDITENMKLAAARAIADSVSDEDLTSTFVVPSVFDKLVPYRVAEAVAAAAVADGVCRA